MVLALFLFVDAGAHNCDALPWWALLTTRSDLDHTGKLLALVLAFAAVGGLVVMGTFRAVEAGRTADVNITGDSSGVPVIETGPTNPAYLADTAEQALFESVRALVAVNRATKRVDND